MTEFHNFTQRDFTKVLSEALAPFAQPYADMSLANYKADPSHLKLFLFGPEESYPVGRPVKEAFNTSYPALSFNVEQCKLYFTLGALVWLHANTKGTRGSVADKFWYLASSAREMKEEALNNIPIEQLLGSLTKLSDKAANLYAEYVGDVVSETREAQRNIVQGVSGPAPTYYGRSATGWTVDNFSTAPTPVGYNELVNNYREYISYEERPVSQTRPRTELERQQQDREEAREREQSAINRRRRNTYE